MVGLRLTCRCALTALTALSALTAPTALLQVRTLGLPLAPHSLRTLVAPSDAHAFAAQFLSCASSLGLDRLKAEFLWLHSMDT